MRANKEKWWGKLKIKKIKTPSPVCLESTDPGRNLNTTCLFHWRVYFKEEEKSTEDKSLSESWIFFFFSPLSWLGLESQKAPEWNKNLSLSLTHSHTLSSIEPILKVERLLISIKLTASPDSTQQIIPSLLEAKRKERKKKKKKKTGKDPNPANLPSNQDLVGNGRGESGRSWRRGGAREETHNKMHPAISDGRTNIFPASSHFPAPC